MDYSNPVALAARRVGQKLGVLRPAVRAWRKLSGEGYEDGFDAALLAEIRPGDVVWDVGANVGFYTAKFARAVGTTGTVMAFEPSPGPLDDLIGVSETAGNVTVINAALSDSYGQADFYFSTTGSTVTDGLRQLSESDEKTEVSLKPGDAYLEHSLPNVIKIDVEGFEREVLRGLSMTLRSNQLRAVFVEVHFLESARRGAADAPAEVTRLLRAAGLNVHWIDSSHLVARRG